MDEVKSDTLEVRASIIEGSGGFAARLIREGEIIVEYIGERISKEESLRRCASGNNYIFHLTDTTDLDGSIEANMARFINHSCAPNAEARLDGDRIWIVALRDIALGEEISFNYGYDLEDFREHPCACRAPNCVGFILAEEFWGSVPQPVEPAV